MLSQIWIKFLDLVRAEVGSRVVDTWFCALSLFRWDQRENTMYLLAPNAFIKDWIQKKYTQLFHLHFERLLNVHGIKIIFIVKDGMSNVAITPPHEHTAENSKVLLHTSLAHSSLPKQREIIKNTLQDPYINPLYSFDEFIVGPSNSLACAAARAVSEKPGSVYNPLFLSGSSGLGKTHLLHAIGNMIKYTHAHLSVLYQTTDRFISEFVSALRLNHVQKFKTRYQGLDVLLLDDIQCIANKEQSQEIFFHIFNTLYDARKQIVVSGDLYPQEIQGIPERLRSRFGCGLITDLSEPTLETKIDILCKKSLVTLGERLDDPIIHFIASQARGNIRQLEGTLIRVLAFASLTKQKVTLEVAQRVLLNDIPALGSRSLEPLYVVRTIAKVYGCSVEDLCSKIRTKELVQARHSAMYLLKKYTHYSLRDIGAFLGGRDHSTVMHGIERVEHALLTSTAFRQRMCALEQRLG